LLISADRHFDDIGWSLSLTPMFLKTVTTLGTGQLVVVSGRGEETFVI
jgi:hypothetical protein